MRLKPSLKFSWLLPKKGLTTKTASPHADDGLLASYLASLDEETSDFTAVVVSLSKLTSKDFDADQAEMAARAFKSYVAHCGGECFYLSNRDIVYIYDGKNKEDVHEAIRKLKTLFRQDPFFQSGNAQQFSRWFDLNEKGDELTAYAYEQLARGEGIADHIEHMLDKDAELSMPAPAFIKDILAEDDGDKKMLDPSLFAKLDTNLSTTDLSIYLKRQPVCAMGTNFKPQVIFQEMKFDIDSIAEAMVPNVDIHLSPWLVRQLMMTLDKRLLSLLKRDRHVIPNLSFSFSLSVSTIEAVDWKELTSHFQALHPWHRIIQIDFLDALSDLRRYFRVAAMLRDFGYRLCLNNVRFVHLPLLDRQYLQTNMVRLMCTDTLKNLTDQVRKDLVTFVDRNGPNRIILFNCDDKKSCKIGYDLGISLFQGRFIDELLDV